MTKNFDAAALMAQVRPGSPCGVDCENDPRFANLFAVAQTRAAVEVGSLLNDQKAHVVDATGPDWNRVEREATHLLLESRHLRVAVILALARLKLHGLAGLHGALQVLRWMICEQWEHVHPSLDPADGNDPLIRINILNELSNPPGDISNHFQFMEALESVVSCLDVERDWTGPGLEEERASLGALVLKNLELLEEIETFLAHRIGAEHGPKWELLFSRLRAAHKTITASSADDPGAVSNGVPHLPVVQPEGSLQSREDVLRSLDAVTAFYRLHEPSSPIPALLSRVRRLVNADFLSIIEELAPEQLPQVKGVLGTRE